MEVCRQEDYLQSEGSLVCTVRCWSATSTEQNQSEEGQKRGTLKEEGWGEEEESETDRDKWERKKGRTRRREVRHLPNTLSSIP